MVTLDDDVWGQAIDRNYDAFVRQLGTLIPQYEGRYALIFETVIEGIFVTVDEAESEGRRLHGADKPYSIQPVTAEPGDLGWFSHVAN